MGLQLDYVSWHHWMMNAKIVHDTKQLQPNATITIIILCNCTTTSHLVFIFSNEVHVDTFTLFLSHCPDWVARKSMVSRLLNHGPVETSASWLVWVKGCRQRPQHEVFFRSYRTACVRFSIPDATWLVRWWVLKRKFENWELIFLQMNLS